ncbi:MAG: hypothetical protein JXR37_30795 [Kiritimatiellae bacterium]|nr:hypothetical protein [Kiritimatiellia bacterium]
MFDEIYRAIHTRLAVEGLQSSADPAIETDPTQAPGSVFNLNSALNLHCGALSVTIEAPCHAFSGMDRAAKLVARDLDATLDAQLVCHQAAMRFLLARGGRATATGQCPFSSITETPSSPQAADLRRSAHAGSL